MSDEACDLLSTTHPTCLAHILAEEVERVPTLGNYDNTEGGDSEILIVTAAGMGCVDFLKAYIEVFTKFSLREGTLASHMAARRGQLDALQYLLTLGKLHRKRNIPADMVRIFTAHSPR